MAQVEELIQVTDWGDPAEPMSIATGQRHTYAAWCHDLAETIGKQLGRTARAQYNDAGLCAVFANDIGRCEVCGGPRRPGTVLCLKCSRAKGTR